MLLIIIIIIVVAYSEYDCCLVVYVFRSLILCVCLHVLMYVSVLAAVMANKVHYNVQWLDIISDFDSLYSIITFRK